MKIIRHKFFISVSSQDGLYGHLPIQGNMWRASVAVQVGFLFNLFFLCKFPF